MVIGQYKVLEKIGEGGMGVVYKAEHVTLGQIVALKVMPSALSVNAEAQKRFIDEARILAKLSHPNIVALYNFFEHDGSFYLVMEYFEGDTLESIIRKSGSLPLEQSLLIFRQLLDGIGCAHAKDIIHRDIKPRNIIVNSEGVAKITDFGIAEIVDDVKKTQTGEKAGTPEYMSPEQIMSRGAGITSDIYALGITLFEMITGDVPFTGGTDYQIMKSVVEDDLPSLKEICPHIPQYIEKILIKAIAKSPSERFQNTKEFSEALVNKGLARRGEQTWIIGLLFHGMGQRSLKRPQFWMAGVIFLLVCAALLYQNVSNKSFVNRASSISPSLHSSSVIPSLVPADSGPKASSQNDRAGEPPIETPTRSLEKDVKKRITHGDDKAKTEVIKPSEKEGRMKEEKTKKGGLYVTSTPLGAEIIIDGMYKGSTPSLIKDLKFGMAHVTIGKLYGYEDYEARIVLKQNETVHIDASLSRSTHKGSPGLPASHTMTRDLPKTSEAEKSPRRIGSLQIETAPPGARIHIDGSYKGITPAQTRLPAGKHTIVLIKEEYQVYTETLTVEEGTRMLNVRMNPK